MKKIKNIFLAVLMLVVSIFSINVNAAENTGTITVNGTEKDRVYDIFKIFDLTYKDKKVAYTIDSDWVGFFFGKEAAGKEYIVKANTGNLNQVTYDGKTYYINITDANIAGFANKALIYAAKNVKADKSERATGDSLEFTGLALGYYLVYPQGATQPNEHSRGSIASLDSTIPNAEVNIKANYPELHKEYKYPNDYTFDVGEYASFVIKGFVPDTTGFETYTYKIHDSWYDGLELDKEKVNFVLKINGKEIKDFQPSFKENSFSLYIDMTKFQDQVGALVEVTYDLLVNEKAINSSITKNEAYLEYSNNPKTSTTTTTPKEIVYVYSSKIEVTKVDGADKTTKLAGATFALTKVVDGTTKYYSVDDKGNVSWVDSLEKATTYTTKEDGVITFAGIKDGDYSLVETKAPEGYNKLPQPVPVKVTGKWETQTLPRPVVTYKTIENNTGVELPETGGFGTKLFIIIGSLLAMVSSVVLVTNKRMAKEEM